jgi:hypothetical protein
LKAFKMLEIFEGNAAMLKTGDAGTAHPMKSERM